jgi:hypothetical protein
VGRALIIVYLAAPIDQASGNLDLATKRQNILSIMFDLGHCVYDPFKAWTNDPEAMEPLAALRIQDLNVSAIGKADLVLAVSPPGVPSVGVPMEALWALLTTECRVALWAGSKPSTAWMWLADQYRPRVKILKDLQRDSLVEAVDWAIKELDDVDPFP